MRKIKKTDYFCGAFLSYLIHNHAEPTLFDVSEKSKNIKLLVKSKNFNIYLKYSATKKVSTVNDKSYTSWNIIFTKAETEYLFNNFYDNNAENYVVLVCGNMDLKNTVFAMLTYQEAIACLGNDTQNIQRRISVKWQKSSPYLNCYGTAVSDKNATKIKCDIDDLFGFNDNCAEDK